MTGTADWYARTQGPSAPMLLSSPMHALGHGSLVPGAGTPGRGIVDAAANASPPGAVGSTMGGASSGSGGFLGQALAGTTQLINGFASALPVVAQQGAAGFSQLMTGLFGP
ncbi:MAG TPA: hypothetical protein VK424_05560 [Thermoplasmata archaeon]|nr:hypothetical protein [Thermoplasmata archaeon]